MSVDEAEAPDAGLEVSAAGIGEREVGAAVLMNAYWHVHVAELILGGATPRQANEACWGSYYYGALQEYVRALFTSPDVAGSVRSMWAAGERALYPAGDPCRAGHLTEVPSRGPYKHWTTRCLTAAVAEDERRLPWPGRNSSGAMARARGRASPGRTPSGCGGSAT